MRGALGGRRKFRAARLGGSESSSDEKECARICEHHDCERVYQIRHSRLPRVLHHIVELIGSTALKANQRSASVTKITGSRAESERVLLALAASSPGPTCRARQADGPVNFWSFALPAPRDPLVAHLFGVTPRPSECRQRCNLYTITAMSTTRPSRK